MLIKKEKPDRGNSRLQFRGPGFENHTLTSSRGILEHPLSDTLQVSWDHQLTRKHLINGIALTKGHAYR